MVLCKRDSFFVTLCTWQILTSSRKQVCLFEGGWDGSRGNIANDLFENGVISLFMPQFYNNDLSVLAC